MLKIPGELFSNNCFLEVRSALYSDQNIIPFTFIQLKHPLGFSSSLDDKESSCNAGHPGSIPGLGRSPGEGNGDPFHCSCLENSMDRGAWRLQSVGLQRVGHSWVTNTHTDTNYGLAQSLFGKKNKKMVKPARGGQVFTKVKGHWQLSFPVIGACWSSDKVEFINSCSMCLLDTYNVLNTVFVFGCMTVREKSCKVTITQYLC